MAALSVNWGSSSLAFAGATAIYLRAAWADAWTLNSTLFATEQTWSLLPSMPVAQIERDYGQVLEQNALNPSIRTKLSIGGYYVKIATTCADGALSWVGFIDESIDEQGGIDGSGNAYGTQRWVAYALPQALSFTYLTRSRWYDEVNTTARWSGSAISFNQGGRPNRTATAPTADSGKLQTHMFAPFAPPNIEDASPFTLAKYWSSRDILLYLQEHAMPLDQAGNEDLPFRIDGMSKVPDWDRPTIETEGKSVLAILEEIVNQGRMLQFATSTDESTTPHTSVLSIYSLASAVINLPNANTHPAATDTLSITCAQAQDTRVTVQASESRSAHQVVVKGAKRQVQATLACCAPAATDEGLVAGWNSTQESAYEAAASGEVGYGSLTASEKNAANQLARSASTLADVYRTLVLNPAWDFDIGTAKLFVEADGSTRYYPWWNAINIAPQLLMKEGIDYSSIPVSDDDSNREYRPPYVLFERPLEAKYLQAEKMSNRDADPSFSVEIGITKEGQGISLDATGAEQHAIANTTFTPLADDFTDYGEYDYIDGVYTVVLTDDRFAEYEFPQAGSLPTRDVLRRKIYYAGEAYRLNAVHKSTVWNVDVDGALVDTGTASARLFIHDDLDALQSIAQIAASWWLVPRKILRLTTPRPSAVPFVGQLLTTLNPGTSQADTINSIVSEIRLTQSRAEQIAPAVYSITTASGELDPLAFVPPPVLFGPVPLL